MSSPMNLDGKYIWIIRNVNINAARNLESIGIKKHQRFITQIKKKLKQLQKDWIPALAMFIKHFWKTYNSKKVIKKMKIR